MCSFNVVSATRTALQLVALTLETNEKKLIL